MDNELVGKRAEGKVIHAARGRSDPPEVTVHCLYRSRSRVVGFRLSKWSVPQSVRLPRRICLWIMGVFSVRSVGGLKLAEEGGCIIQHPSSIIQGSIGRSTIVVPARSATWLPDSPSCILKLEI